MDSNQKEANNDDTLENYSPRPNALRKDKTGNVLQENFIVKQNTLITLTISAIALLMSIYSTCRSNHLSSKEKNRNAEVKIQEALDLLGHETTLMVHRLQTDNDKLGDAHDILVRLEKEHPKNPDVFLKMGLYFHIMERHEEALGYYEKAYKIDPLNPDFYNYRGFLYLALEDPRALKDFEMALKIQPNFMKARLNRAIFFKNKGDYDAALKDCAIVREAEPRNPIPRKVIGDIYYDQSRFSKAIVEYNWAIRFEPSYYDAYYNRGLAYYALNHIEKGIEDFEYAIQIENRSADAFFQLGRGKNLVGDSGEALKYFEKAIMYDPGFTMAHYRYAQALTAAEKYKQAEVAFDMVTDLDSNFTKAWIDRANVLVRLKLYNQALECADKAKEIAPEMPAVHFTLGIVYMHLNDPMRADASFEKAAKYDPSLIYSIENRKAQYYQKK